MKTTFKFFTAVLAIVAAVSCTKEGNDGRDESPIELVPVSFSAIIDSPSDPSSPDKRTTLADDGLSVHWTADDQILVFKPGVPFGYSSNSSQLTVGEISGASAIFSGDAVSSDTYHAIYPYALANLKNYNGVYHYLNGLSSQNVRANNFSTTSWGVSNVALATSVANGETLKFKNMLAHFKFALATEGIHSIVISTSSATDLTGASSSINGLGGTLGIRMSDMSFGIWGNGDITVTNNGADFVVNEIYYVAIPAASMNDLTFTFKDASGNVLDTFTRSSFTAEANTIYNLGTLSVSGGGEEVEQDKLTLSENSLDIPANGGSVTLTLSTNNPWSINANLDWLTVSPTSGDAGDNQIITISASANLTGTKLYKSLEVNSGTLTKYFSVNQAKQTVKYTLGDRVPYATSLENGAYYVILRQGSSNEYWVNNNVTTGALSITGISDLTDIPVENIFIYHKDDSKKVTDDTSYGYTSGGAWQAINTNGYLNSDLCFTASSLSDAQYFTQGSHWGETDPNIDIYMKVWSTNGTAWSYKFISYVNYAIGLKTTSEVTNNNQRKWYVYKVDTVVSE